mmetsp:Transcript_13564/g.29492  ORF Transcript_13564/g.29492 Transcript_13564/m.29492 type:complete len:219 (+) Transcript_13564:494-1150(+)
MKFNPPPAGLNTILRRGQRSGPKLRSGRPAERGHAQNGVDGTLVSMATPSVGFVSSPRCGNNPGLHIPHVPSKRCIPTILSYGTSNSILPIQNRSPPSEVMSTHRTELYQNHATANKLPMEMETTVPCAPMGTAAMRQATKAASKRKNRSLNAKEKGAEVKLRSTDPSSVTYVNVCAMSNGSSGSTIGGGRFRPTCPSCLWFSFMVAAAGLWLWGCDE